MQLDWTAERTDTLKSLWSRGLSASRIAGELGGITRNAVIGKVHRLGLSKRAAPIVRRTYDDCAPRPRKRMVRLDHFRASTPETASEPEISDLPADHSDCAVSFFALTNQTCRWPLGDPADLDAMTFCGAVPADDRPYCHRHCRIAYQPPRERPRRSFR